MINKAIALLAQNAPEEAEKRLLHEGFEVLRIPPSHLLTPPVCYHTDMLIFPLGNKLFCHESYAKTAADILRYLSQNGYEIKTVGGRYGAKYPDDVRFNIAAVGKTLFIGKNTAADEICSYAEENGYRIIRINQGYAKCSTCIISDTAIITADESIYSAAHKNGISALKINAGSVLLPPYEYGFIGGASGVFGDTVYFTGDILKHPDGGKIADICKRDGKRVFCLSDGILCDIGSILFI